MGNCSKLLKKKHKRKTLRKKRLHTINVSQIDLKGHFVTPLCLSFFFQKLGSCQWSCMEPMIILFSWCMIFLLKWTASGQPNKQMMTEFSRLLTVKEFKLKQAFSKKSLRALACTDLRQGRRNPRGHDGPVLKQKHVLFLFFLQDVAQLSQHVWTKGTFESKCG